MSSQKRNRSASQTSYATSSQSTHPELILNPHAHSESTLKQLHIAGLTDAALLPSSYIPHFPHRPISHQQPRSDSEEDPDSASDRDDDDDDDAPKDPRARARRAKAMRNAQDTHLALLTATLHRALNAGDIPRAKRAFALIRRSEVRGKAVDLRRGGLWALGVEVLMREGLESASNAPALGRARWGTAANMPAVHAYLEELVRLYPYNRLHPTAVSDVAFYPVLFGCEVYDAWAEHRAALRRLEEEDDDEDAALREEEQLYEDGEHDDGHAQLLSGRERRVRRAKADLALAALARMRAVAARMDGLLAGAPYSRDAEMLRLRGMVALYVGDLGVPPPPRTRDEEEEGGRTRDAERERAGRLFRQMREHGGRVDAFTERWLGDDGSGVDEVDDEYLESAWSGLPMFSSLPMR